jgi:hypothetical protein
LAGIFLISSAGMLQARDRDDKCEERVHKAERNLQRAVEKHGEHSKQAEKKRHDVEEARERCGHEHHDFNHH